MRTHALRLEPAPRRGAARPASGTQPVRASPDLQGLLGNQGVRRPAHAPVVQPKLRAGPSEPDCGACSGATPCPKCAAKKEVVVRRRALPGAASSPAPSMADGPASLGPGRPLDAGTRADFEPLFGHDFSGVRIHSGARAARSAHALDAQAYTVGRDIVFSAGQYAPRTRGGRALLAHELAHVVQQRFGGGTLRRAARVGSSDSRFERAADAAAGRVLRGEPAGNLEPDPASVVRRRTNFAGTTIDAEQRRGLATSLFQDIGVMPARSTGTVAGPRFLLHDTSGASSRATLTRRAADARGPMGSGPHVFIPATGLEIIQRPDFFDARRPTTTEFEKGTDRLDQAGREAALRAVWAATLPAQRRPAFDRALAGFGLSETEIADERTNATRELNATSGDVHTTAYWTIEQICAEATRAGATAVARPGRDGDLTTACATIVPVLRTRLARLGSTVAIELVQVGHRPGGNENTCNPNNPDMLPLPTPAYSNTQYWNALLMYLRAAVQAGRFPEVTTHFVVDAFAGGHWDPRCFDLTRFYADIARMLAPLGHAADSIYGVEPSYGTTSGTHTVWWHDGICHGPPPPTSVTP